MREPNEPRAQPAPGDSPEVPEELRAALGDLFGGAEPPAELASSLSRAAADRMAPKRIAADRMAPDRAGAAPNSPRWRPLAWGGLAAAAGLALSLGLHSLLGRGERAPGPLVATATDPRAEPADLDGNGRVDIYDAYLLARGIEASAAGSGSPALDWDQNGDGRVDRLDVESLAQRAVELPR